MLAAAAEDDVQPRVGERCKSAEGGGDVRRLRVVDVADTAQLADELDPMRHAFERSERLADRGVVDAGRSSGGCRRRSVLAVVRAGYPRLGRELVIGGEVDAAAASGNGPEVAWHHRDVFCGLALEQAELGVRVGLERAVPVQVVGLEVEEYADPRVEGLDVLELERRQLADDPGVRGHGSHERRQRTADVASDLDRPPGGAKDRAEELARRRLAVGSGDAQDRVRQQSPAQLDLAPDGNLTPSSFLDQRCLTRDPRALHDEIDPLWQCLLLVSEMEFDTELPEPSGLDRVVPVEADDCRSYADEHLRGCLPGTGEADDEDARSGELVGAHRVRRRRTGGSRGRRARTRPRRRSRTRSRSAP